MESYYRTMRRALRGGTKGAGLRPSTYFNIEALEDRCLMTGSAFDHVLLLSVDGLHQTDIADPVLRAATNPTNHLPVLRNIVGLEHQGVTYTNAFTPVPSDSGPGTQAEITGRIRALPAISTTIPTTANSTHRRSSAVGRLGPPLCTPTTSTTIRAT